MKVIQTSHIASREAAKAIIQEAEILSTLKHPFVVQMHASWCTQHKLFMVYDYHEGGNTLAISICMLPQPL